MNLVVAWKFIGLRLQELEQQASNERMLAAACAGDLVAVEESLRFAKGDCNSQQTPICIQSFQQGEWKWLNDLSPDTM